MQLPVHYHRESYWRLYCMKLTSQPNSMALLKEAGSFPHCLGLSSLTVPKPLRYALWLTSWHPIYLRPEKMADHLPRLLQSTLCCGSIPSARVAISVGLIYLSPRALSILFSKSLPVLFFPYPSTCIEENTGSTHSASPRTPSPISSGDWRQLSISLGK